MKVTTIIITKQFRYKIYKSDLMLYDTYKFH